MGLMYRGYFSEDSSESLIILLGDSYLLVVAEIKVFLDEALLRTETLLGLGLSFFSSLGLTIST